jgi:23S rRNA (cytidine1920-2'-O)/16S rRNA (cytidine1409-2'-O)-methyltransferase
LNNKVSTNMVSGRTRLDQFLVSRGFFTTRARARDAIIRGAVEVDGKSASKPSQNIADQAVVSVHDEEGRFVSRAAIKLRHALDYFHIDAAVGLALDLGASTGGFTQVLLERGAKQVIALDVGRGQLAPSLRSDPRVLVFEGLNARDLKPAHLPAAPDLITCDVSFISLKLALPPALELAASGAGLISLVKPQFEAGRNAVGGSGIIRHASIHRKVCGDIAAWLSAQPHWRVLGVTASPILGGDGNREFLIAAEKSR